MRRRLIEVPSGSLHRVLLLLLPPLLAGCAGSTADRAQPATPPAASSPPATSLPRGGFKPIAPPGEFEIRLPTRTVKPAPASPDWPQLYTRPEAATARAIVQLLRVPTEQTRAALADAGIELGQPLSGRAYLAKVKRSVQTSAPVLREVRWIGPWLAQDKLAPELSQPQRTAWARRVAGQMQLVIKVFADADFERTVQQAQALGAIITGKAPAGSTFTASMPVGRERELAQIDDVRFVEPATPPGASESDRARSHVGADVGAIPAGRPNGSGVVVGVFDGGHASSTHPDFGNRSAQGDSGAFDPQQHATMTAGIIAGSGARSAASGGSANQFRGMAPAATIRSYSFTTSNDAITDFINDVTDAVQNDGVNVLNNSWGDFGCATLPYGAYVGRAPFLDDVVRGGLGRPVTVVFSVGNERDGFFVSNANPSDAGCITDAATPFANYTTVNHPKSAKNIIAVGAIDSGNDAMSDYSSWGPTLDGRLRPDVVASGQHNGTMSNGVSRIDPALVFGNPVGSANQQGYRTPNHPTNAFEYAWFTQTSSASAIVSGGVALMIDAWRRAFPGRADPLPATVRALLVHNARDLDDATTWYNRGPDYASGYGLVRINQAVQSLERGDAFEGSVAHQTDARFFVTVAAGAPLRVTLAWDDPAAIENANPTLINDLDLVVTDPNGVQRFPWTLDPANPTADAVRTQADHVNNLEQVVVDAPVAGTWSVIVRGTSVATARQNFSLVTENGFVRQPVDLVLALDTSSSMNSLAGSGAGALSRIELLRRSATLLLETWRLHAVADDRVGIATFSSNVSTTPNAVPALQPLLPNFNAIAGTVGGLTASGCTALGGALQIGLNSLPTGAINKRAMVAITDGMQSTNPFVGEAGTPARLRIDTFAANAALPFDAFFCTNAAATGPGGAAIVPDGIPVADHGVEIHAIGIGVNGAGFQQLIERLASENRGLHHFTTAPNQDLDLLFVNDLVRALKTNTLEIIASDAGALAAGATRQISFPVNGTSRSVTVVLSWQGATQTAAIDAQVLGPNGTALAPTQTRRQGNFTLLKFDRAQTQGALPGAWQLVLRRAAAPTVSYQTSIIADESCLHYEFATPTGLQPAGSAPRVTASVSAGGRPQAAPLAVTLQVAAPAQSFGNLLAAWVPKTKAAQRYRSLIAQPSARTNASAGAALEAALAELNGNPAFIKAAQAREKFGVTLRPASTKIDPTAGGASSYAAVLPALTLAGTYGVRWQIEGQSACGVVKRQELGSMVVSLGKLDRAKSSVRVTPTPANTVTVSVKPVDRSGNLLGPGASHSIGVSIEGLKPVGPMIDRLDGSYRQTFSGRARRAAAAEVTVTVGGETWSQRIGVDAKTGK